jgi:signal transduction histidine kinase
MGQWKLVRESKVFIFSNKTKLAITFVLVLLAIILNNLKIQWLDFLIRDTSQIFNTKLNSTPSESVASVTINATKINNQNKLDVNILISFLKLILSEKPRNIILFFEPNDITFYQDSDYLVLKNFFKENKIYLNRYSKSFNSSINFNDIKHFDNYPYFFEIHLATDSDSAYFSNRRMLLDFHNSKDDGLNNSLIKMGIETLSPNYFSYGFVFIETTQIYTKYPNEFLFPQIQFPENFESKKSLLKNKIVVVSRFDEFNYFIGNKAIGISSIKSNTDLFKKRIPLSIIVSNQIRTLMTGDYIKYVEPNAALSFIFLFWIFLIWWDYSIKFKLIITFVLGPAIFLLNNLIYTFTNLLFDLTSMIIFAIIAQYLTTPYFVLLLIRKFEISNAISKYKIRIQTISDISKSIAHDIRSPLSTVRLLSTRVLFNNENESSLFKTSLQKISEILDELINRNFDNENLSKNIKLCYPHRLIKIIINEFRAKNPSCTFIFNENKNEDLILKISENDLYRIITNIFDNSISATKTLSTPRIEIFFAKKSNFDLTITILDNGIGISDEIISILGNQRITTKPNKKGHGLGLISTKQIIYKYNGQFEICKNESAGTRVNITFSADTIYITGKSFAN